MNSDSVARKTCLHCKPDPMMGSPIYGCPCVCHQPNSDNVEALLKNMVEDTVIFITKDLHSLMTHDEVVKIRRYHKDEILKNIPEAKAALLALLEAEAVEVRDPNGFITKHFKAIPLSKVKELFDAPLKGSNK